MTRLTFFLDDVFVIVTLQVPFFRPSNFVLTTLQYFEPEEILIVILSVFATTSFPLFANALAVKLLLFWTLAVSAGCLFDTVGMVPFVLNVPSEVMEYATSREAGVAFFRTPDVVTPCRSTFAVRTQIFCPVGTTCPSVTVQP